MHLRYLSVLLTLSCLLSSPPSWAAKKKKAAPAGTSAVTSDAPPPESPASSLYDVPATARAHGWGYFEGGGIAALQGSGGNAFSGIINWKPTFAFTPAWAVRGNLGMTVLKGSSRFLVAEYEAIGAYSGLSHVVLEAGAGAQTWFGNGGTSFIASGEAAWKFPAPVARVLDRVFVGYTACFFSSDLTHQIRAGVGASF